MMHDPLSDAMNMIKNAEDAGKREVVVPYSKLILRVLEVMKENNYIGDIRVVNDPHPRIRVSLIGAINNCRAIRPRFVTKKDEYGKWEKRYLPGENIGIILISTPQGLMTHYEARKKGLGGRLIGYVY